MVKKEKKQATFNLFYPSEKLLKSLACYSKIFSN